MDIFFVEKIDHKTVVGFTKDFIASQEEVVYLQLPKEGEKVEKNEPFCMMESSKAMQELLSPVSGIVLHVNSFLCDHVENMKTLQQQQLWLIEIVANE
jgi:glycine cleavage system H protein